MDEGNLEKIVGYVSLAAIMIPSLYCLYGVMRGFYDDYKNLKKQKQDYEKDHSAKPL
jgi:hypothetical protein